jgi:hypothetical protein
MMNGAGEADIDPDQTDCRDHPPGAADRNAGASSLTDLQLLILTYWNHLSIRGVLIRETPLMLCLLHSIGLRFRLAPSCMPDGQRAVIVLVGVWNRNPSGPARPRLRPDRPVIRFRH